MKRHSVAHRLLSIFILILNVPRQPRYIFCIFCFLSSFFLRYVKLLHFCLSCNITDLPNFLLVICYVIENHVIKTELCIH